MTKQRLSTDNFILVHNFTIVLLDSLEYYRETDLSLI